jgi:hypothetical protein
MEFDIYALVKPLIRKYSEDTVQEALLRLVKYNNEVFNKPAFEFEKHLRHAIKGLKWEEIKKAHKGFDVIPLNYNQATIDEDSGEHVEEEDLTLANEAANPEHIVMLADYEQHASQLSRRSLFRLRQQLIQE